MTKTEGNNSFGEPLFLDIGSSQQKKYGQNAYGDFIASKRYPDEFRLIAVLSDGLGSGIKASILANMTAKMLLKFVAAERNLIKAAETVMNSLPVCQVRKISYSTFSVVDCFEDGSVKIVEEGNPDFLHIRSGKVLEHQPEIVTSKKFSNRSMRTYAFNLEQNDRLLFCSDGVTQAGLGGSLYKLGWRREGLKEFVEKRLEVTPDISCRHLAQEIVAEAQRKEPTRLAKDDISCMVLHLREPRSLVVFTGPPYDSNRDAEYVDYVMNFEEMGALFVAMSIELATCEEYVFEKVSSKQARNFAVTGGVAESVRVAGSGKIEDFRPYCVDGLNPKTLRDMSFWAKKKLPAPGNILEIMACPGGCVAGAGCLNNQKAAAKKVSSYAEQGENLNEKLEKK